MDAKQRITELLTHEKGVNGSGALRIDEIRALQDKLGEITREDGSHIFTADSTGKFGAQTSAAVMDFLEMPGNAHLILELSPFAMDNITDHVHENVLDGAIKEALNDVLSLPGEFDRDQQFMIQRGLEHLGHDVGVIDGRIDGPNSMTAIANYTLANPALLLTINADILNDADKYEISYPEATHHHNGEVQDIFIRAANKLGDDAIHFLKVNEAQVLEDMAAGEQSGLITRAQLFMTSFVDPKDPDTQRLDPKGVDGWAGAGTAGAFANVKEYLDRMPPPTPEQIEKLSVNADHTEPAPDPEQANELSYTGPAGP